MIRGLVKRKRRGRISLFINFGRCKCVCLEGWGERLWEEVCEVVFWFVEFRRMSVGSGGSSSSIFVGYGGIFFCFDCI